MRPDLPRVGRRAVLAATAFAAGTAFDPGEAGAQVRPSVQPFLRIELGTHASAILRALPSPDGSRILTVSADKTARLWAADGALLRTFRPPIAPGDEGQLLAAAMTPDGAIAWVGGQTGAAFGSEAVLYGFDVVGSRMRRLPTGVGASITALAFSPDGGRMVVGFARDFGIAFVDFQRRNVTHRPDLGIRGGIRALTFGAAGQLYVAAGDGTVRIVTADQQSGPVHRLTEGGLPGDIALSPDGRLLAVGLANAPQLRLLDGATLAARPTPPLGRALGAERQNLRSVAWSGGALLAAGFVLDPQGRSVALRWPNLAQPPQLLQLGARDTVTHLAPGMEGGGFSFATADPSWGVIRGEGQGGLRQGAPRCDFRGIAAGHFQISHDATQFGRGSGPASFRVSADGLEVEFGSAMGGQQILRFDVRARQLSPMEGASRLPGPVTGSLPLRDWLNGATPRLGEVPLPLDADERARAAALLPRGGFVLGTDQRLRLFGADGREGPSTVTPATVWGVQPTADGRQIVAALGDGTLRWYDLAGARPLALRASLFVHADRRRWLLWTPEGFFDHADDGGQDLAGFHLNRGPAEAADWVAFHQLHRVFFAQDLVAARLARGDETALRERLAEIGDVRRLLDRAIPPRVTLAALCFTQPGGQEQCLALTGTSATRGLGRVREAGGAAVEALPAATLVAAPAAAPVAAAAVAAALPQPGHSFQLPNGVTEIKLRLSLEDRGGGLGQVDVFVNGQNAGRSATRGLGRVANAGGQTGTVVVERSVLIGAGLNAITVRAYDSGNGAFGESAAVELNAPRRALPRRPTLHVLSIGVDDYSTAASLGIRSLSNAVNDSRAVDALLRARPASEFGNVNSLVLNDEQASRAGIQAAFASLAEQTGIDDTVVLFLAGHGQKQPERYLFLPYLPEDVEEDSLGEHCLDDQELVALWSALPSHNGILLLDTCHAGGFSLDFAGNLQNETGRFVLAAASAQEAAADAAPGQRNSPFTVALLEALNGSLARPSAGRSVDQLALGFHVRERAPVLAASAGVRQRVSFRMSAGEVPHPFALTRMGA